MYNTMFLFAVCAGLWYISMLDTTVHQQRAPIRASSKRKVVCLGCERKSRIRGQLSICQPCENERLLLAH
jgi:hypothetical protein